MKTLFVERVGDPVLVLASVKEHLIVEHNDDDALITQYMAAAHSYVENHTRRQVQVTRRKAAYDAFPECIEIANPPIRQIESIRYTNTDGVVTTLPTSEVEIDTFSDWGRIVPVTSWPSTKPGINRVIVEYLTGYGAYTVTGDYSGGYPMVYGTAYGTTGPQVSLSEDESTLRQAMYLLIAHWYETREAVVVGSSTTVTPLAVDRLLSHFQVIKAA